MRHHLTLVAVSAILLAPTLGAQSLADRVNGAPAGAVQFSFAARPGVCGNGRGFIQTGNAASYGSYVGSFTTTANGDVVRTEVCQNGPVHVVIDRAGRDIISI